MDELMQRNHLWSPSGEIERKLLKQPNVEVT